MPLSVTLLSLAITICGLVAFVMVRWYNQWNTFVDVILHRLAARFSKEVDSMHGDAPVETELPRNP
jgi:hypothetical protein